ncbi:zinc finger, CCHC-type containing protein [Tanacetum coccineum]
MFQQEAEQELFETVKAFHACKQEEGQSVSTYVMKMKAYLDQMERLGYPMPLVLGVNMILTSVSKDYDQSMQNYNMHDMGKTIPELHAMLKLAEKGIPNKTHVVLAIRQGQIQKPKSQARGKGNQRGKGNCKLAYDPKHKIPPPTKKEHPAKGTECIFTIELFSFPKSNSWIYDTGCGTHICNTIQGLKGYQKLNKGALELYVGNGNTAAVEAIGSFDLILPSGMILVLDNSVARILNMVPTKKVNKAPYEMWHGKVLNLPYLKSRVVRRYRSTVDFDEIQSEDAQPSENISLHQHEVELDTVEPQTNVIPVRRSARIPQAPEQYNLESKKCLEAINAEMQSMKDNQVWNLVDLPPNCKTVGSKWLFKKKNDMDGNIHTYKARLVAKGFTQTYRVDYEETFSPVADIKAIRILIAIAAYYDYEICILDEYASFKDPFIDLSKLLGAGIRDLMRRSKSMVSLKILMSHVKRMKGIPYASAVGFIMYAVRCTRPDVAFSQNLTSRYQQNPGKSHWTAVKNILKYLRNTKDMFLVYGGDSTTELGVTCYTDASAVDWKSSKQSTTAMSSMEAYYIAAAEASIEAI